MSFWLWDSLQGVNVKVVLLYKKSTKISCFFRNRSRTSFFSFFSNMVTKKVIFRLPSKYTGPLKWLPKCMEIGLSRFKCPAESPSGDHFCNLFRDIDLWKHFGHLLAPFGSLLAPFLLNFLTFDTLAASLLLLFLPFCLKFHPKSYFCTFLHIKSNFWSTILQKIGD